VRLTGLPRAEKEVSTNTDTAFWVSTAQECSAARFRRTSGPISLILRCRICGTCFVALSLMFVIGGFGSDP